ncbi:recombinase family protein, partial [Paraburkholderia sediminicola]|uniref:recombinase family protein n=1 Tax=Paraburkholderia sediminicola TaxID=458836 RepID=UPI0038BA413C
MLTGYARVSAQDQNLELQREALTKAGCQTILEDEVKGTQADRPCPAKAPEILREGDTLAVWKLDRLGRSVKQLVGLVGDLHKQDIQFKSLTDAIDSDTPFRQTRWIIRYRPVLRYFILVGPEQFVSRCAGVTPSRRRQC